MHTYTHTHTHMHTHLQKRAATDTVYFNADMQEAQEAVEDTLRCYDNLLSMLSPGQKASVVSSIGLRMQELKAHQQMIEESMKDS